jgi:alanine racemase
MTADASLTIDLDALAANHALLRAHAGAAEVAPVVKADGYGLGASSIARRLQLEGASRFFVARVSEGEALRRVLGPEPFIYVLDGCPQGAADRLTDAALIPVLNSTEQVADWNTLGRVAGLAPTALHIDTGMNRLGLSQAEAEQLAGRGGVLAGVNIDLVISHLSRAATPEDPFNRRQREALAGARRLFPSARFSLANSTGVFLGPEFQFDMVRPGITLYGGGPFQRPDPRIAAVATLEAPILQVRLVPVGDSVGYGAAWTATKPTQVAIVAAGYADGVLRAQSPGGYGWLDGGRRPLLGRVSMDLIALDVTNCAGARPGAMVQLLGADVLVDEAASAGGTMAYELLTRLSARARRVYRGQGA